MNYKTRTYTLNDFGNTIEIHYSGTSENRALETYMTISRVLSRYLDDTSVVIDVLEEDKTTGQTKALYRTILQRTANGVQHIACID